MQRNKQLILVMVALAALMALGSILLAQDRPRGGPQSGGQMLEQMTKALDLTEEQQAKIKPIIEAQAKKTQEVFADDSIPREDKMAKIKEIREASAKKINPILTDEQQKKFAEMQQRGRGQRQGGQDKKDPG